MAYRNLEPLQISATLETLAHRIQERFPDATLAKVASEIHQLSKEWDTFCAVNKRRQRWIRFFVTIIVTSLVIFTAYGISALFEKYNASDHGPITWTDLVQGLEAVVNDIIFLGIGLFFLLTIEKRVQRAASLAKLHELRSLAHVIDMHQLTKDPERIDSSRPNTVSSPKYVLTRFQLTRYLDYCSEMLSLIGKLAALHSQDTSDTVILSAVNEIENLTSGISRKIWQKIMIIMNAKPQAVQIR